MINCILVATTSLHCVGSIDIQQTVDGIVQGVLWGGHGSVTPLFSTGQFFFPPLWSCPATLRPLNEHSEADWPVRVYVRVRCLKLGNVWKLVLTKPSSTKCMCWNCSEVHRSYPPKRSEEESSFVIYTKIHICICHGKHTLFVASVPKGYGGWMSGLELGSQQWQFIFWSTCPSSPLCMSFLDSSEVGS